MNATPLRLNGQELWTSNVAAGGHITSPEGFRKRRDFIFVIEG